MALMVGQKSANLRPNARVIEPFYGGLISLDRIVLELQQIFQDVRKVAFFADGGGHDGVPFTRREMCPYKPAVINRVPG
jgi:hypothetical protein